MRTKRCSTRDGLVMVICLLAILLGARANAAAQSSTAPAQEQVKVVGHLALQEIHVNQMFMQSRDGKFYLYLHRPTRQAFAVVDVSKPEKPVLVERAALAEPAQARVDVNSENSLLAIAVSPEGSGGASEVQAKSGASAPAVTLPTETVRLMDLSDPKHPRTLKTFTGVTSMLPDDSRKLIYIVNNEGLWLVRHHQSRPMPLCSSADSLIQDPNCQ
jgi:hypothetical protein